MGTIFYLFPAQLHKRAKLQLRFTGAGLWFIGLRRSLARLFISRSPSQMSRVYQNTGFHLANAGLLCHFEAKLRKKSIHLKDVDLPPAFLFSSIR